MPPYTLPTRATGNGCTTNTNTTLDSFNKSPWPSITTSAVYQGPSRSLVPGPAPLQCLWPPEPDTAQPPLRTTPHSHTTHYAVHHTILYSSTILYHIILDSHTLAPNFSTTEPFSLYFSCSTLAVSIHLVCSTLKGEFPSHSLPALTASPESQEIQGGCFSSSQISFVSVGFAVKAVSEDRNPAVINVTHFRT